MLIYFINAETWHAGLSFFYIVAVHKTVMCTPDGASVDGVILFMAVGLTF